MRILLINKYNYLRSGTERYLFDLKRLLEGKGHRVETFAMAHPRNRPATYKSYFVPELDFRTLGLLGRLQAALRVIWYPRAARHLAPVLDDFQPDLVHLGNIYHHLSPALLPEIAKRGIPIIQTLNDYKLICPNYLLYTRNAPCQRCRNRNYFQALRYRCLHGSIAWSLIAAIEMSLHKRWQIYETHVATFAAPSAFVKKTVEAFGIPADQVVHTPLFLFDQDYQLSRVETDMGYFAYVGRLSQEKGLPTLIRAMRHVPQSKLLVIGEGTMRPVLEKMVEEFDLTNIEFTGYLSGQDLESTMKGARFSILPSEWYEVFGLSIIESLVMGKPVVAARIGGIPELVESGQDGLLFKAGDEVELAACLRQLWGNPERTRQMGLNGRSKILSLYTPENHYNQLLSLYQSVLLRENTIGEL